MEPLAQREVYSSLLVLEVMAKIRAKGSRKAKSGPTTPNAIGCIFIVVVGLLILGALLYFGISRG
jgi:hypothetical protein